MMNEKANVTKELNAKHRKSYCKLDEKKVYWKIFLSCQRIGNVLTATPSRAPRWASVNLGIFICMQCSGIHRSLGVHISKVRSATLDTWLPEQVAFTQSMGNGKANSYWEAELPPNYDRVGIENFIRANLLPPSSLSRIFSGLKQLFDREAQKQVVDSYSSTSHPRVDCATDLFDMLSMADPHERSSESTDDDSGWAGFQCAQQASSSEKPDSRKDVDSHKRTFSGVEDLFSDSPSSTNLVEQKPQKDLKSDILSLFEKLSTAVCHHHKCYPICHCILEKSLILVLNLEGKRPFASNDVFHLSDVQPKTESLFAVHQQQLALLAQQQTLLMAAAAQSAMGTSKSPVNMQQPGLNGSGMPIQNWPNVVYQILGLTMPSAGIKELQNFVQVRNIQSLHKPLVPTLFPIPGFYPMGQGMPVHGTSTIEASPNSSASAVFSETPSQRAKDYDFSSLTQGLV
ncbi:hypothetical protein Cgig2_026228 [Carnegiea gigantea]|uniref:Arf-GAP domain-containing protein n=1 Tax=Carnegiea gigantea TaxID=171969 RepID=A0A9Q1KFR9_9CARY|nr:hypothetical protein Cgig2_026228 [Carnegiea gigantea]